MSRSVLVIEDDPWTRTITTALLAGEGFAVIEAKNGEEGLKRAREHTPGQAPVSPRLLLALWLYATSEGIGSARALARLCESHDAYRWLCGGVSVNYHGLADFRTAHPDLLDRLLTESVATLSAAGVIDLDEVVQDGVRVRASAAKRMSSTVRVVLSVGDRPKAARLAVPRSKVAAMSVADRGNRLGWRSST